MSIVAVRTIPQSDYADPVLSSIQNDQFVVAKRKVIKCIDRSLPHTKDEKKRAKTPMGKLGDLKRKWKRKSIKGGTNLEC